MHLLPEIVKNTLPPEMARSSLGSIKEENILKALGVPAGKEDDFLIQTIRKFISVCIEMSTPCATYAVFQHPQFLVGQGRMIISGQNFHLHKMVTSALSKSTSVAFFVGTCGDRVEQHSKKLMKDGHLLEGLIVDLIGSEIAERVTGRIHQKVTEDMAVEGLQTTNRYSPGYCNWPVSDQHKLFSLLGSDCCGISLTPSSLMLPIKSVSGIIGIGHHVLNRGYACSKCDAGYCLYRDKF